MIRIRIRMIRMFLGLLDPHPIHILFVRIRIRILPSSTIKKWRKTLISTVLWLLYDFLSLKNDVNVPSKRNKHNNLLASWRSLTKRTGSTSGSVSHKYGTDPLPVRTKMSRIPNTATNICEKYVVLDPGSWMSFQYFSGTGNDFYDLYSFCWIFQVHACLQQAGVLLHKSGMNANNAE